MLVEAMLVEVVMVMARKLWLVLQSVQQSVLVVL